MRSHTFLPLFALLLAAMPCFAAESFEPLKPVRTVFRYTGDVVGFDAIADPPRMLLVYQDPEKPTAQRIVVYAPGENGEYAEQASLPVTGDVRRAKFLIGGEAILFVLDDEVPMPRFENVETKVQSIRFGNAYFADLRKREVELFSHDCLELRLSPTRDRVSVLTFYRGQERISHDFLLDLCCWEKGAKSGERKRWLRLGVPLDGASPFFAGTWSPDGSAYAFSASSSDPLSMLDAYKSPEADKLRAEVAKFRDPNNKDQLSQVLNAFGDLSKFKNGDHQLMTVPFPRVDAQEWDARTMAAIARQEIDKSDISIAGTWPTGFADFPKARALAYDVETKSVLTFLAARIDGRPHRGICRIDAQTQEIEWLLDPVGFVDDETPVLSIDSLQLDASPGGESVLFAAQYGTFAKQEPLLGLFEVASRRLYSIEPADPNGPRLYHMISRRAAWVGDELWIAKQDRVDAYPMKPSSP